jgi:hypothetical protein
MPSEQPMRMRNPVDTSPVTAEAWVPVTVVTDPPMEVTNFTDWPSAK